MNRHLASFITGISRYPRRCLWLLALAHYRNEEISIAKKPDGEIESGQFSES